MRIILFLSTFLGSLNLYCQDYYSDRLFVKIKDDHRDSYALERDLKDTKFFSSKNVASILPVSKHPFLSSTYEIVFENEIVLDSLISQLSQLEQIEYAEKVPIYQLFFTPNDPLYASQWNLAKIQADLAWNLGQGCTNVKIAVTDDGFLLNHEDLVNQWYINSGEINGNGIDDDGNGYVDDWRGWDAANNDNDPSATAPTNSFFTHGTHVAGIVAAQTHNSLGIASIGYNCKMIPVKIGLSSNSSLTGAFQGLDYAVNASGCDVINMSWGGGGWSATYQALFNIAKAKGILCVAAAGNSNTPTPMYPASYNHVISVAASSSTDARASFSNYGSTIDVTAPGVNIQSCLAGATNAYGNMSGTSMASPLVAGLCGLMKCYNPMPADSIEACLKRTSDNINAQNPSFTGQLGTGRINAFQALQCLTKKPKSDFIALDTFQCIGKSVRYIVKSSGIPTLTYSWSFSGGTPSNSTSANPVVTYSSNGFKSATLITCNSLGCDTITKTNYVNIDTPKAWLTNRKYTSYNSNPVIITFHFKGNPPYNVTLTDGTNNFTQTNIRSNPYFFSIVPKKDTSLISISSFSDSSCMGNRFGLDTIYRVYIGGTKDTTICSIFKTSNSGAIDIAIAHYSVGATTYNWLDNFGPGELTTERWTCGGTPCFTDAILKFNFNSIPPNAIINSAYFSIYANNTSGIVNWTNQPTTGNNNSAKLNRITSFWSSLSYPTNYPTVTTNNEATLPQTPTAFSDHTNIDVKNLIQDIITSGSNNGILLKMITNNHYNALQMHSRLSADTSKHPKLVVCYTIPGGSVGGDTDCDTTNLNTGKVLHLDFNGNTQDKSGNGNHATNYGASAVAGKDGVANTAYRFDSTNYMSVAHHSSLNLRNFSITALLKPLKFNTNLCYGNNIISKGANGAPGQWALVYGPADAGTTCVGRDTNLNNFLLCGSTCQASWYIPDTPYMKHDKWNCLVTTYDSTSKVAKIYVDGKLRHQWTTTWDLLTSSNTLDVLIGKYSGINYPYYIQATIDDIRIYNRVLAPSEVKGYCGTCNVTPPPISASCLKVKSVQQISENIGGFSLSLPVGGFFGMGCSNVGDWDGDGVNDLMVGAPLMNSNNGRIYFLRMNANGTVKSSTIIDNTALGIFTGVNNHTGSQFGLSIKVVGDINGDGVKDIIVTGPNDNSQSGSAFVLFMNTTGSVNSVVKWFDGQNGISAGSLPSMARFGWNVSPIGDWNNDGVPDVIIGAGNSNEGGPNRGAIYICLINSNGTIKQLIKNSSTNNTFLNGVLNNQDRFGMPVFLGDINNDGLKDFAVGTCMKSFSGSQTGAILIVSMNSSGTVTQVLNTIGPGSGGFSSTLNNLDLFGYSLTEIGDYNKDGIVDLMVGAIGSDDGGTDRGAAWILFLNSNGTVKDEFKISQTKGNFTGTLSNGAAFGYNLTNMGDLDKNGLEDFAIGSYEQVVNGSPKGSVWILFMEDTCAMVPSCDTSGLVLCMSMDGNANDSTKYNNHGTKIGGISNTIDRNGKSNSALSFNGTNAYIEVPSASSIQLTNELTISLWINQTSTSTQGYRLVDKITATTGDGYLFDTYGHPTNATWRGRTTRFVSKEVNWHSNNKPYNLNSWVHVAVTHKNGLVSYYTNGVLDTSYSHSVTALNINTLPLRIGAGNPLNFYFNGAMDDLKIYRRALTAMEVSNLYTKPFSCNCVSTQPPPCDTAQRYTYTQCFNDSIQVMARAGIKYQWSPVSGLSNDIIRNPKVFVSSNQRYLVSYTSSKNCQLIDTIDVEVKAAAVYPKMDDQLICTGDSVQMTIPIYATNIVWSPNTAISSTNSKNPFFFPTTPTTYYLEFRDTFGCLHRDTFVVHTKVCCPARARFSIPKDLLCFGESLSITNTSKGPITSYNWNFSTAIPNTFANANPPSISFPSGGSYSLRLIVTNGSCLDTMIKTVNVVHIIPNAGKDTTNCLGAFTTQLGESAISDWSYNWTPTKYLSDPKISDPICSIVNDSVHYVLEIIDRNSGCKAYDTVVVYTNRSIDSTVQNLRICGGDSVLFDGIQRKTSGNYYYTLKKVDGICDSLINVLRLNVLMKQINPPITLLMCDEYIDAKGKKHTESLIEYDTIKSKSILNCDSILNVRKIIIYKRVYRDRPAVSGCAPFRYNGKTYLTSKMKADSIRIRNINLYNCDTIEYINIIVHPRPKALIIPSIPNPVMYKQTVTLTASGGQTYLWLQIGSTNQEIEYKINNTQPKLYTVRVTDENDCWDTVSYTIKGELPDTCFYGFPNVFSPNQDNLNDEYIPNMDECTEIKVFAIYDRWGEKVFETNQQKGWNGFFKGKPAPMAVYLYYAEMITPWGIRTHKGSFTLVR